MVTVQGVNYFSYKKVLNFKASLFNFNSKHGLSTFRLHHDQQTAHALESAAAAYSNYPMSGRLMIKNF
jgi:hypothetical protein